QLELAPTWYQLRFQAELAGEPSDGGDDLIGCLAVHEENSREGKAQLGTLFGHGPSSSGQHTGPRRPRSRTRPLFTTGVYAAVEVAALATYGLTILAGSTTRLNSSSLTKPSLRAASLSARSLSIA